jgi:hypothetical protein
MEPQPLDDSTRTYQLIDYKETASVGSSCIEVVFKMRISSHSGELSMLNTYPHKTSSTRLIHMRAYNLSDTDCKSATSRKPG